MPLVSPVFMVAIATPWHSLFALGSVPIAVCCVSNNADYALWTSTSSIRLEDSLHPGQVHSRVFTLTIASACNPLQILNSLHPTPIDSSPQLPLPRYPIHDTHVPCSSFCSLALPSLPYMLNTMDPLLCFYNGIHTQEAQRTDSLQHA